MNFLITMDELKGTKRAGGGEAANDWFAIGASTGRYKTKKGCNAVTMYELKRCEWETQTHYVDMSSDQGESTPAGFSHRADRRLLFTS